MARRRGTTVSRPDRVRLGDFWLEPRPEREEWCIAWYDVGARTRRRRSTGVRYSGEPEPPVEAQQALAAHFADAARPAEPQAPAAARVADLIAIWLRDHVAKKNDPARYAISAQHLVRFFDRERKAGRVRSGVMVSDVNKDFVTRFIAFRKSEGVGGDTISRDLAALRGALNHAWREELITSAPFIRDVDTADKAGPRELVYSQDQIAALLEAAYRMEERRHVFLYTLIQLSTHGRSQAILDLHSRQIRDGLIYFLPPGEKQTSKRRSIVPIAPTLAPWLENVEGKVIRYRAPIAATRWAKPDVPEYFERDCYDLGKSFEACLVEAGLANPELGLVEPCLGNDGEQLMLPPRRKLGETEPRLVWRGRGTPNTLRHTLNTELHARGVPEAQIETAAGHLGEGTNKRNYRHLRPGYLKEFIGAVEDYWREMTRLTTVHLRTQCGPNVVSFAGAKAKR